MRRMRAPSRRVEPMDGLFSLTLNQNRGRNRMSEEQATDPMPLSRDPALPHLKPADSGISPGCPTCGTMELGGAGQAEPVYVLGQIEARFPRLSVEKEFMQAVSRADTSGKTDTEVLHTVLSDHRTRYLARQMCYVLTVQGMETYILFPRDPLDLQLLVEAIRPVPGPQNLDIVIGLRGPIGPPAMCNGLLVPMLVLEQLYSFDRDHLLGALPRPERIEEEAFRRAAGHVLDRILNSADNVGIGDAARATNYLLARYHGIYETTAEMYHRDFSLVAIESRPSRLNGARRVTDVILRFENRKSGITENYFTRVDVTELFPFLVSKIAPYFDH